MVMKLFRKFKVFIHFNVRILLQFFLKDAFKELNKQAIAKLQRNIKKRITILLIVL